MCAAQRCRARPGEQRVTQRIARGDYGDAELLANLLQVAFDMRGEQALHAHQLLDRIGLRALNAAERGACLLEPLVQLWRPGQARALVAHGR